MKLQLALDTIEQAVNELLPAEDPQNDDAREAARELVACAAVGYVLIPWPDSQEYMDEEWFEEEAIAAIGVEDTVGSAAYFIPIERFIDR